jgi:Uncharacterized protein conserved in bacteria
VRIEFDPGKDVANRAKHGVSLALAGELDGDAALVWVDERYDYGEWRMVALAPKTLTVTTWHSWIMATRCASSACVAPPVARQNTMSKASKRPDITLPTAQEDQAIRAAAKADPDAQPLTPKQLQATVPLRALRGRPKSTSTKQLVSVRYSPEVIAWFKATGEGWQARMDSVLRSYVQRHSR